MTTATTTPATMTPTTTLTSPLTLYFAPHVCSLAPHIVLRELGVPFQLVRVDLRARTLADGRDFRAVNPKGYVPALTLDDGSLLSETAVILRHLADTHPERDLAPRVGTRERLRFDELLHFVATELHKAFAPFTIMPHPGDEARRWAADRLASRVALLEPHLGGDHVFGDRFTVLDAYVYFALRTYAAVVLRGELTGPARGWVARMSERPAVRAALEAERTAA